MCGLIAGFCTRGPYQFRVFLFCTSDKKKLHPDNESKQERLRIRRDRERQARAQETAEEKEVRLAKRREKHRALKFKVTIALDANRASQQLRRDTETPEARQARLQQMAASTQTSRASGKQGRSYHCFLVAQKPPQELLRKLGRAPYN